MSILHSEVREQVKKKLNGRRTQGRYSEAEPLFLEALGILERRLGTNHPYTVGCRENLADLRDRPT
ncbi:MAG: tetratricopeptide repeat protein [Nostoc sp. CreGUA01]